MRFAPRSSGQSASAFKTEIVHRTMFFSPDISRVECIHIQGIRAEDVVVYLNALITGKMGALGSSEGREKRTGNRELHFAFLKYFNLSL